MNSIRLLLVTTIILDVDHRVAFLKHLPEIGSASIVRLNDCVLFHTFSRHSLQHVLCVQAVYFRYLRQDRTHQFSALFLQKPQGKPHILVGMAEIHNVDTGMILTWLNLLKPTGHVMHQQFNIRQLYVLPTLYLCVLYLSENKQRLVPLTA